MREAILLFGGEADLELALKKALAPLRILVRTVPRERYSDSVGLLAGDNWRKGEGAPSQKGSLPNYRLCGG